MWAVVVVATTTPEDDDDVDVDAGLFDRDRDRRRIRPFGADFKRFAHFILQVDAIYLTEAILLVDFYFFVVHRDHIDGNLKEERDKCT